MNEWNLEEEGPVRRPFQQLRDPMVRLDPGQVPCRWVEPARGFHAHPDPAQAGCFIGTAADV